MPQQQLLASRAKPSFLRLPHPTSCCVPHRPHGNAQTLDSLAAAGVARTAAPALGQPSSQGFSFAGAGQQLTAAASGEKSHEQQRHCHSCRLPTSRAALCGSRHRHFSCGSVVYCCGLSEAGRARKPQMCCERLRKGVQSVQGMVHALSNFSAHCNQGISLTENKRSRAELGAMHST